MLNRTGGTFSTAWYNERIERGQRDLATFIDPDTQKPLRFRELQTSRDYTISAAALTTNFWILPDSDIFEVQGLYDATNERNVAEVSHRELQRHNYTDTGDILKYSIEAADDSTSDPGLLIWKKPTADVSVRLYIYKYPPALASDAATPVFPEMYHRAVELFAAVDAATIMREPDLRDDFYKMAVQYVRDHRRPTQQTRRRRRSMRVWS